MSKHPLEKFGYAVAGKTSRWITVVVWIALLAILGLSLPQVNSLENYAGDELPAEMTSIQADDIIAEQFPSDAGIPLLIVWYKEAGLGLEDLANIQALYKKLEEEPLEGQTTLPPFAQLPPQALAASVSENGTSFITPIFFSEELNTQDFERNLEEIRAYTKDVANINPYDTDFSEDVLHARFSGPVGIAVDATSLFASADFKLMVATVIIILVILLVIYRSPILAVIPIVVVTIAYLVISPLLGFMVEQGWIAKDAQAIAIMIVLLFGAGTDYCLFLITKYRDMLLEMDNKFEALAQAIRDSAGAIAMSGFTVVIGLATLALADYGAFQRFAVPFSFGVLLTMIAVLTLLPAVLSILGRKAFWPFVPRTEEEARAHAAKKNKPFKRVEDNHAQMRKIGTFVTNNSWLVILVTGAILVGLAWFSTNIKYNYDILSSFPEDIDSREGFKIIEENFTPGQLAPVKLIVDTEGVTADLTADLAELPYVGIVKEPAVGTKDANITLYEIDLDKDPYSNEAMDDVEDLKEKLPAILADNGLENASFWIGGETSAQLDTKEVQLGDEKLIQPVMIVIIFLVLVLYLRAIVTAVHLMVTVIVSFFAALGLGWIIIHYLLGQDAIGSSIPLYSFVFIIALGNDYNIFMISDIWKNRAKGIGHRKSISGGVASTGAVITSAGLILAGTFGVLASLPIQLLVQFGIVTAVGVLLDTFIVRPLLVPALINVFDKLSYWPGKLWKKDLN